ncbi:copper chaperone PCu(A)C [Ideonella livida]|uniref:Copper chaperone PCu(A)C n=1 Tax=Ideonella livida TaxID=2707176 RepID=A0A7C9TKP9_9BURK|nr:copper chaperone PCu(A)C [Ideonella livida]NDY91924.1 copper chaperone PCu(A)C [Ideonella livida]
MSFSFLRAGPTVVADRDRRRAAGLLMAGAGAVVLALAPLGALAHDYRFGTLVVDHPYAPPSITGQPDGSVYIRTLRNGGDQPERLLGASTPVAQSVEIHQMTLDPATQVMRMRAVEAVPVPAQGEVSLKHGGSWHLMLIGLKQPLQHGDRIPLTLRFERAGTQEIRVWVMRLREAGNTAAHQH